MILYRQLFYLISTPANLEPVALYIKEDCFLLYLKYLKLKFAITGLLSSKIKDDLDHAELADDILYI